MAVVEILDVHLPDIDIEHLVGFSLDSPQIRTRADASALEFAGWILGHPVPVASLELVRDGGVVGRIPVQHWRQDVASGHPAILGAERAGFQDWVDVSDLGQTFALQVMAVLTDETRLRVAHLEARVSGAAGPTAVRIVAPRFAPIGREQAYADIEPALAPLAPWRDTTSEEAVVLDTTPRCSIVIPVHNRADLTRQCLDALLDLRDSSPSFEIIVVDDASGDDTPRLLAAYQGRARSVTLAQNGGFATACNAGAAAARGDYLVFLNNDTIPQPGWLTALVAHADANLEAAVVGAKLLYPDETVQHAGVSFGFDRYPHHLYAGFPADHPAVNKSRPFRAVTAACCLVRGVAFHAVGGFDRAFVNGWEDVDLCLRLGERGHQVHYCAESVLYHLESASRNVRADREQRNRDLYATRWMARIEPDAIRYYVEDGLFWMATQGQLYPIRIETSPLLGLMPGPRQQANLALLARANQATSLQRGNLLLHHRVMEAEYRLHHVQQRAEAAGLDLPPDSAAMVPEPRLNTQGQIHWPDNEETNYRLVTVVLLLRPDADLGELAPRLIAQHRLDGIEYVAVARGSIKVKTEPLRLLGPTIVVVDPIAYPEGAARNLAATYARGPIVVFLDLDAIPADERWLANMLAPLDADENAGVSVGRVVPDGGESPPPDDEPAVHLRATAVRTDLIAEIPLPAEDDSDAVAAWAREVEGAGWAIRHAADALAHPAAAAPGDDD